MNCRKDSFVTHRAFCDALAEESARFSAAAAAAILAPNSNTTTTNPHQPLHFNPQNPLPAPAPPLQSLLSFSSHDRHFPNPWDPPSQNPSPTSQVHIKHEVFQIPLSSPLYQERSLMTSHLGDLHVSAAVPSLSATALLQKAATVGSTIAHLDMDMSSGWQNSDRFTRDFLGLAAGEQCGGGGRDGGEGSGGRNMKEMLSFTGGLEFHTLLKNQGFGYAETWGNC